MFDLIYDTVRQVPPGRVATYGQIARIVGRCSAQMVGFALAALSTTRDREVRKEVPWQRIINAQGKISPHGFGLGSKVQRELLAEEGILFDENGVIDLAVFGWDGVFSHRLKGGRDLL